MHDTINRAFDLNEAIIVYQAVEAGQGTSTTTLPDTAVPGPESGALATIGLLLIVAAHTGTRRKRQLPVA